MDIQKLLNTTAAGQMAKKLDANDGAEDGFIKGSIWNEFVKEIGTGKEISENGSISIENAMKSITTYAVREGAKSDKSANDLAADWMNKLGEATEGDNTDGVEEAGEVKDADKSKDPAKMTTKEKAAQEQGLRPTYNKNFYYSETEKEHYKWNSKTNKFVKYPNIAYFNKDQSYVRKYKNPDGSAKVIDYSADGYPTKMQAKNWQNKNYTNEKFAAEKLGLQETYATKSYGIYYDKATKMHYQWNKKTHAFDAFDKDVRFVTKNYHYRGNVNAKITNYPDGSRKEVIKVGDEIFENRYNKDGNLQIEINKDKNGVVKESYEYKYDASGKCIQTIHKDANGKVIKD